MTDFDVLEPVIDPNNRITFLLDWEITMKCNLDCSYCGKGIYGGHDNSQPHPPLSECLKTIDFMFAYVDLYMKTKPQGIRHVILNVYGGESLHHPNIVTILQEIRKTYQLQYHGRWDFTVTTTTNAIIPKRKLSRIIPLIDEFTVSYHVQNSDKQKDLFKTNILDICAAGKRLKCVILMHPAPDLFADAKEMIAWCNENNVKNLPRQLDSSPNDSRFNYATTELKWLNNLYAKKTYRIVKHTEFDTLDPNKKVNVSDIGRACCGGRSLCKNQSYSDREFFVHNKFPDWFCSVNEFFLYIKQVNGEIYTNKDCKMNFEGQIGPIGNLSNARCLLTSLEHQIAHKTLPTIKCKKTLCFCGLCAPKAKNKDTFDRIMEKYRL